MGKGQFQSSGSMRKIWIVVILVVLVTVVQLRRGDPMASPRFLDGWLNGNWPMIAHRRYSVKGRCSP